MQCLTIVYPNQEGATFNFDYYLNRHIPMVARLFGNGIEVRKGISSATGSVAPYACLCTVRINSVAEYEAIMMQGGAELIADVPNYTTIEPVVQIDEVVLDAAMNSAA